MTMLTSLYAAPRRSIHEPWKPVLCWSSAGRFSQALGDTLVDPSLSLWNDRGSRGS
jgi:hypothetical protein